MDNTAQQFHSGFVAVVGRPNVGKSTLVNRLVGEKVSIVSPKPQTTRNRILGIVGTEHSQVVFVDTPGIHKPKTKLGEYMEKSVQDAVQGIDILCVLIDASKPRPEDHDLAESYKVFKVPKYLLLNKTDLVRPQDLLPIISSFADAGFDMVLPISAKAGEGVDILMQEIYKHLPQGPKYYPDDLWTDQNERQMIAEIIREKALMNLREEVPHGIGVEVLSVKEIRKDLTEIQADIYCERASHKTIIIGRKGEMLQKIGSQARADIEKLLDCHVNLQLWVKVRTGWMDSSSDLKSLGYWER
ncbi:MAG: GTPase Era [Clostridia bacterium]|nr:GTPase Era [Clostridia bacterium]